MDVHVLHHADNLHILDLIFEFLFGHVFESVFVLVELEALLKVLVCLDIVHEVLEIFVVLFFLVLFLLLSAVALLNHHTFIFQLLQLEDSCSLSNLGKSDQHKLLVPVDLFNLFSVVQLAEIESFNQRPWCQISHIPFDFNIDPLILLGDIVVEDLVGVLVEGGFDLMVIFPVDWVAV